MTAVAGPIVDVYLGLGSRYSYLASTQFDFIAGETGATFHWIPVVSADLYDARPDPFTKPASPTYDWPYRHDDAKAWADYYGVPFREPMYRLSYDPRLLVHAALAAGNGAMRVKMMKRLFAAVFVDDRKEIGIDACIDCAEEIGWKRHDFRRALSDPTVETERLAIVERAKTLGVFGVPFFLAGGRAFFGNDRLTLLQYHLMTMPPPDLAKAGDVAKTGDAAKPGDLARAGDLAKAGDSAKPPELDLSAATTVEAAKPAG